jgi:hypothetical protein
MEKKETRAKVSKFMTIATNKENYQKSSLETLNANLVKHEDKLNSIHKDTLSSPFKLAVIAERYVKEHKLDFSLDVNYFLSEDLINQRKNKVTLVTGYMNPTLGLSYLITRNFNFKNIVNGLLNRTHLASIYEFRTGDEKNLASDKIRLAEQYAGEISRAVKNLQSVETLDFEFDKLQKQWLTTRDDLTKKISRLETKITETKNKLETAKAKGEGETKVKAITKVLDTKKVELDLLVKAQIENIEPTKPKNENFEVVESQLIIDGVNTWYVDNKNYIKQFVKIFSYRKVLAVARLLKESNKEQKQKFLNGVFTESILQGKTVLKLTVGQKLLLEHLPLSNLQSAALKNSIQVENKENEIEGKTFITNNFTTTDKPKVKPKDNKEKIELLKTELEMLKPESRTYQNKLARLQKLELQAV